ncbi:MAG: nucleotidyltransferase domain-containing protein [Candidatus Caldatribacteriaceae bacterium]
MRVFFLEKEKLLEALEKEAQRLGEENYEVEKIVLFGSLACDRALPGSDANILVVLTESKKPFIERIEEWLARICIDFPVDVFPYTKEELSNPLVQEALKNGKVLFERKRTA